MMRSFHATADAVSSALGIRFEVELVIIDSVGKSIQQSEFNQILDELRFVWPTAKPVSVLNKTGADCTVL